MRQRYIVTYDICEQKRLRQVFKVLKGYGEHLQFSVFRCDLSKMSLISLKVDLNAMIHSKEDQVLIIDVGPTEGRGEEVFESLGRAYIDSGRKPNVL